MPTETAFRSLAELAQALRAGEFSALELTRYFLDRIDKADRKLNAYAEVYRDEALAAAEAADRIRRSGWPVGQLHGLPIAVKDLCDIEGKLGAVGSKAWATRRGTTTATVVERLRAAGMIILGKTQMVEFAFGGYGTNPLCGTPWNPWDLNDSPHSRRLEQRLGRGGGRRTRPCRDRFRHWRVRAYSRGVQRYRRPEDDLRAHQPARLLSSVDHTRLGRPDDAHRRRCRDPAGHPGRPETVHDPNTYQAPAFSLPGLQAPSVKGLRVVVLPESQLPGSVDPAVQRACNEAARVLRTLGVSVEERAFPFGFEELTARNGELIAGRGLRDSSRLHRGREPGDRPGRARPDCRGKEGQRGRLHRHPRSPARGDCALRGVDGRHRRVAHTRGGDTGHSRERSGREADPGYLHASRKLRRSVWPGAAGGLLAAGFARCRSTPGQAVCGGHVAATGRCVRARDRMDPAHAGSAGCHRMMKGRYAK